MSQRRRHSVAEAVMNTFSGLLISFAAGFVIYPAYGYDIPAWEIGQITLIFTVISIGRGYVWRRFYNWLDHGGGWEALERLRASVRPQDALALGKRYLPAAYRGTWQARLAGIALGRFFKGGKTDGGKDSGR